MRVLIALIVVLATTMPDGVHAMPMLSALDGMAGHQPCPSCPQQTGHMNPDKMPACQILACARSPNCRRSSRTGAVPRP
jgi:hypothetical protein